MFDEKQCSPGRRRILRRQESSMKPIIFNSVFSLLSHTLLGAYFFYVRLHHFFLSHTFGKCNWTRSVSVSFPFEFWFWKTTKSIFILSLGFNSLITPLRVQSGLSFNSISFSSSILFVKFGWRVRIQVKFGFCFDVFTWSPILIFCSNSGPFHRIRMKK